MENVYMYLKSSGMYRFGTVLVAHTYRGKTNRQWYNEENATDLLKFKDVYRFVEFSVAHRT